MLEANTLRIGHPRYDSLMSFLLILPFFKRWERLRCRNYLPLLLLWQSRTMDPHNRQNPPGERCINGLRGNASRLPLPLLHHNLLHSLLPRRLSQRRPRGLSGDVRDPVAVLMIVLIRCRRCSQPITWCHLCLARRRQPYPLLETSHPLLAWDFSVREVYW